MKPCNPYKKRPFCDNKNCHGHSKRTVTQDDDDDDSVDEFGSFPIGLAIQATIQAEHQSRYHYPPPLISVSFQDLSKEASNESKILEDANTTFYPSLTTNQSSTKNMNVPVKYNPSIKEFQVPLFAKSTITDSKAVGSETMIDENAKEKLPRKKFEEEIHQDKYSKNGESQNLTESIIIDPCSDEEESSKVSHEGHLRTLCAKLYDSGMFIVDEKEMISNDNDKTTQLNNVGGLTQMVETDGVEEMNQEQRRLADSMMKMRRNIEGYVNQKLRQQRSNHHPTRSLCQKINTLAKQESFSHVFVQSLHTIRELGNAAAHLKPLPSREKCLQAVNDYLKLKYLHEKKTTI